MLTVAMLLLADSLLDIADAAFAATRHRALALILRRRAGGDDSQSGLITGDRESTLICDRVRSISCKARIVLYATTPSHGRTRTTGQHTGLTIPTRQPENDHSAT